MYDDDSMLPNIEPLQDIEQDEENQTAYSLSRWFNVFMLMLQASVIKW